MGESPKQPIPSAKTPIPMQKGKEERVDYKYIRHGMVNIFMDNELLKTKSS
ncbi:hypothetical protein [Reichenbachiella sp. MALMAid0571]|uniref:hypothetical protein n=1 Tax=Reichenbachiella sp. MALMAid0571 TaxID=3143939 RepID=UPI0032DF2FBD